VLQIVNNFVDKRLQQMLWPFLSTLTFSTSTAFLWGVSYVVKWSMPPLLCLY